MNHGNHQGAHPLQTDPFPGGRRAAEARLAAIDPARYSATRNHLDGAVTRLSPYIRHGVLTLAEVREAVFERLHRLEPADAALQGDLFTGGSEPRIWNAAQRRAGEKLISELGWRDYWQRLWRKLGDGIWNDREPLKTGHPAQAYAPDLPADLTAASTGLACIDAFATELMETGWLHNHARMWFASYVVHWRRVRWQAGARWFLQHLLDGDPASNNLSWQWVASSFSHKPYIFNRTNLERFSSGRFCSTCPRAGHGESAGCPFEASYEALQERLFLPIDPGAAGQGAEAPPAGNQPASAAASAPLPQASAHTPIRRPLVWVHEEALGAANPALLAHPDAPALAVLDADWLVGRSSGRIRFLRQCLAELPLEVREGDGAAELLAAARALGCDGVVSSQPVDPSLQSLATKVAAELPLQLLEPEPFVALPFEGQGAPDLRRFSRYWRQAEAQVWKGY